MRYRARDVYALLMASGCERDPDGYRTGDFWSTSGCQVFLLPRPDVDAGGVAWFEAEVLDENLRDRWTGVPVPVPLTRHP